MFPLKQPFAPSGGLAGRASPSRVERPRITTTPRVSIRAHVPPAPIVEEDPLTLDDLPKLYGKMDDEQMQTITSDVMKLAMAKGFGSGNG